jgi:hypothetical protein
MFDQLLALSVLNDYSSYCTVILHALISATPLIQSLGVCVCSRSGLNKWLDDTDSQPYFIALGGSTTTANSKATSSSASSSKQTAAAAAAVAAAARSSNTSRSRERAHPTTQLNAVKGTQVGDAKWSSSDPDFVTSSDSINEFTTSTSSESSNPDLTSSMTQTSSYVITSSSDYDADNSAVSSSADGDTAVAAAAHPVVQLSAAAHSSRRKHTAAAAVHQQHQRQQPQQQQQHRQRQHHGQQQQPQQQQRASLYSIARSKLLSSGWGLGLCGSLVVGAVAAAGYKRAQSRLAQFRQPYIVIHA